MKSGAKGVCSSTMKVLSSTSTERDSACQRLSLSLQRGPLYEDTDIETEEVVVGGESEESTGQMYSVGKLSSMVDSTREDIGSSSEDDSTRAAKLCPLPKKELMSPEGRVALDHSYSSGSCDSNKGASNARKKIPVIYEKTMPPRPVYSSASLAKRSLDIMLHNDKINILRQMSQIFNHEKPPQPDTDNTLSSSDDEEEKEDLKDNTKIKSKLMKEDKATIISKSEDNFSRVGETVKQIDTPCQSSGEESCPKAVSYTSAAPISEGASSSSQTEASANKLGVDDQENTSATTSLPSKSQDKTDNNDHILHCHNKNVDEEDLVRFIVANTDIPFHGLVPNPDPKVHHVLVCSAVPDEKIHVQSRVGESGETVDIIDGFYFASFLSVDEMVAYSKKINQRNLKVDNKTFRKKRRRAEKHLAMQGSARVVQKGHTHTPISSSKDSGAFASNDLDEYLDNAHFDIRYTIPKCKATGGVERFDDDIIGDLKETQASVPSACEPDIIEPESPPTAQSNSLQIPDGDIVPSSVDHYEEVNAVDILYPKEKYKYYYNKELCKETKADGSSVFVRRGGNLVPLTSVFKRNKPSEPAITNKKSVELVYIYDEGQLLTLGGSLTKINPSNSESVRARVVLPVGVPPIMKGETVDTRSINIQAVEINEDMAKFALTALWDPNPVVPKSPEIKIEPDQHSEVELISISLDKSEKSEAREDPGMETKVLQAIKKAPVKPTRTNILDIIAAKLAMSDEESDKMDEVEDIKPNSYDKNSDVEEDISNTRSDAESVNEKVKKSNIDDQKSEEEVDVKESQGDVKEQNSDDNKNKTDQIIKKSKTDVEYPHEKVKEEQDDTIKDKKKELKPATLAEEKLEHIVKTNNSMESIQKKFEDEDKNRTEIKKAENEVTQKDADKANEGICESTYQFVDLCTPKDKESDMLTRADDREESKKLIKCENGSKEDKSLEEKNKPVEEDIRQVVKIAASSVDVEAPVVLSNERTWNSSLSHDVGEVDGDEKILGDLDIAKIKKDDVKLRIIKNSSYKCLSLTSEMKRLSMNFVNYIPQKDFQQMVIQTSSDVILAGAERKQQERRMSGRFRDSTIRPRGTDYVQFETSRIYNPPDPSLLEASGTYIPLSEASQYIKNFKLNIPWYKIKGISIWCMDHSCYDCRCLTDPTFHDPLTYVPEKTRLNFNDIVNKKKSSALEVFENAIKVSSSAHIKSENQSSEDVRVNEAYCTVMNIIVNNTEARRRYSWKLKEWSHTSEIHSARTVRYTDYTKKDVAEETQNMSISGLAAKETTPQQLVESVVKSLKNKNEKINLPSLSCGETFEPFMGDSLTELQSALGLITAKSNQEGKQRKADGVVPVVDLTSSNVENMDISPVAMNTVKLVKVRPSEMAEYSKKGCKEIVKRKRSGSHEPPSPVAKRMHTAQAIIDEGLQIESVASTVKQQHPGRKRTSSKILTPSNVHNSKRPQPSGNCTINKSLSLQKMMTAEENRGELELDLTDNVPGNALLVAEARFRKLIHLNIIGVIEINIAGRCIIGTVESIRALRVMQCILNMINNNTLNLEHNIREILFPPPNVGTRSRFVMIRCDLNRKWEIVGVVQKKGPALTKGPEHKAKTSVSSKPSSFVPQVIDLEEEEEQKEKKTEKLELLPKKAETDKMEPTSPADKDNGTWEGSLPMITSVHSASNFNMAEIIASPNDVTEEDPEKRPPAETSQGPHTGPSGVTKSIPDLIPVSTDIIEKLGQEVKHKSENIDTTTSILQNTIQHGQSQQHIKQQMQLLLLPTAFNVAAKTSTTSTLSTPTLAMKTMRLNLASDRIFGNYQRDETCSNNPALSVGISSDSVASGACGLGKLYNVFPKENISMAKSESNIIVSNREVMSHVKPPVTPGAVIHPSLPAVVGEGHNIGNTAIPVPNSKMLCIPSSGGVSKVVLVPSVSGGQSSRMMLLPTIPGTSGTDNKMKMVLMQSAQENNKMILIPASSETSDSSLISGSIDSEKKKMLVLPSNILGNLISRTSAADQAIKSKTSGPTLIADSSSSPTSCKGTLLVPLSSHATVPTIPLGQKDENGNGNNSREKELITDKTYEESSDVLVIGSANNSLTITRMRTSSELSATQKKQQLNNNSGPLPLVVPSTPVPRIATAETNVSTVTTVSSTMPVKDSALPNTFHESTETSIETTESTNKINTGSSVDAIVNTTVNSVQLNSLLESTHKDMVKDGYTGAKPGPSEKRSLSEGKQNKEPSRTSQKNMDRLPIDDEKNGVEVVKDMQPKSSPIKKFGSHWSAVDLSLGFKSVKFEWLLGTIRKNILVNIYRMSLKTHSSVTLNVKYGMCTSMLYGLARSSGDQQNEVNSLPILILGSVVSAVMSSSSTPDSMLFQLNSIKYFIRENTGELSSYTYDTTGEFLVKFASKKRGDGGEIIGIGEKVPIQKMREQSFATKTSQQPQEERPNLTERKDKIALDSQSGQDEGGCSCTVAGDFMCMGHSDPWKKKAEIPEPLESATIPKLLPEKQCSLSSPASWNASSSCLEPANPQVKECEKNSKEIEQGTSEVKVSSHQTHSYPATDKLNFKTLLVPSDAIVKDLQEDIVKKTTSDPMSEVQNVNVQGSQSMNFNSPPATEGVYNQQEKEPTSDLCESDTEEDETEDVDVLGDDTDENSQSILFMLRQQINYKIPDEVYQGYKPCPRSKKAARMNQKVDMSVCQSY